MASAPASSRASRGRARYRTSLAVALGVQAAVLLTTLGIIVLVPRDEPEAAFTPGPPVGLPTPLREEARQRAALDAAIAATAPAPAVLAVDQWLPEAPVVAVGEMPDVALDALGAMPTTGWGTTLAGLDAGGGNSGRGVSFLGIETEARRLVICFDISRSVLTKAERAGFPLTRIRDETAALLDRLDAHTVFALIQFARRWDTFAETIAPATPAFREAAQTWLRTSFRTDGRSGAHWAGAGANGIEAVLTRAFAYRPDVIFVLSDGDFQRNQPDGGGEDVPVRELAATLRKLQAASDEPVALHFLGFGTPPDLAMALRPLFTGSGGTFRVVALP